jgi:hypothetical protein
VAKLEAAIDAGKGLVALLKFPADGSKDQAAVISFNREASVVIGLSHDPIAIALALDELRSRQSVGTRIDRGLIAGLAELQSPRHRAANKRVVILVTDGVQTNDGTAADVLTASQAIKSEGIPLWTVALGNGADVNLLRAAATSPEHFRFAPNAEGLRLIYEEIARGIPCGGSFTEP